MVHPPRVHHAPAPWVHPHVAGHQPGNVLITSTPYGVLVMSTGLHPADPLCLEEDI